MSVNLNPIKIPSDKVKRYHRYFENYQYAQRFIDQMKTYPHGTVYLDNEKSPNILYFQMPWINILAGDPSSPMLDQILDLVQPALVFYPDLKWKNVLTKKFGEKLEEFTHRTYKSDKLNLKKARRFITKLPDGYTLEQVDQESAEHIDEHLHAFSRTFESVEGYVKNGLGYCIKHEDTVVSHAGSIFPFEKHLEIQVDTDLKYRGKGLATVVCAKLVEYCLMNDITPYWEAHTPISAKIAEKLGFTDPQLYDLFINTG